MKLTMKMMKPFKKGKGGEQEKKESASDQKQEQSAQVPFQHQTSATLVSLPGSSEGSADEIGLEHGSLLPCSRFPLSRLAQVASRRRWQIHESILDVIGQTPIVKLQRMGPPGVDVYVKCENNNPGGSLKDRLAAGIIEWAELHGQLKPGQTVVEASSGNTGKFLKRRWQISGCACSASGHLEPGQTVVEASSGNTGKLREEGKHQGVRFQRAWE